jgi:hypothetical protein
VIELISALCVSVTYAVASALADPKEAIQFPQQLGGPTPPQNEALGGVGGNWSAFRRICKVDCVTNSEQTLVLRAVRFCLVLTFARCTALPPRKKCSMGDSGTAKVCPYCEGKGYVSVAVDLPPDANPCEELSRTTWVRNCCPLCDGKGRISGDSSTTTKL